MKSVAKWIAIGWSIFCLIGVIYGLANVSQKITTMSEAESIGTTIGIGIGLSFWFIIWVVIAGPALAIALLAKDKKAEYDDIKRLKGNKFSLEEISLDDENKKCPMCVEVIKLEAIKCRFCGHIFDPNEVARQVEERKAEIHGKLSKESEGLKQCPQCGSWDIKKAFIEDGSFGDWCPHCKKSIQKMKN